MKTTCPNCKHTFDPTQPKAGVRICAECKGPIRRHDKWFFRLDGRIQHRHCEEPTVYELIAEKIKTDNTLF